MTRTSDRDRARNETLEIPDQIRAAVDERDQGHCRVCGEHLGVTCRAQHHILYGAGVGARRVHSVENIISVGWLPGQRPCHDVVHANKHLYQSVLVELANGRHGNGVTANQILRWNATAPARPPETIERIEQLFHHRTRRNGRCLLWVGPRTATGYGCLDSEPLSLVRGHPHQRVPADEAAFYFAYDRWPLGPLIHLCDIPACVESTHLREPQ